jgi:hypothetical protein
MDCHRYEVPAQIQLPHQPPMRCFFNLVSEFETIADDVGIEVEDLATARSEALKAIQELRLENEEGDWLGWRLEVVSATGGHLYSVDLYGSEIE